MVLWVLHTVSGKGEKKHVTKYKRKINTKKEGDLLVLDLDHVEIVPLSRFFKESPRRPEPDEVSICD